MRKITYCVLASRFHGYYYLFETFENDGVSGKGATDFIHYRTDITKMPDMHFWNTLTKKENIATFFYSALVPRSRRLLDQLVLPVYGVLLYWQGKVLWCDTGIPSILALIVRTRCQRNTRGQKNPRSQAFGRYGVETTPKTVKSCVFFLERILHISVIFLLCICYLLHEEARTLNKDKETPIYLPHIPPSITYIRVYTLSNKIISLLRQERRRKLWRS